MSSMSSVRIHIIKYAINLDGAPLHANATRSAPDKDEHSSRRLKPGIFCSYLIKKGNSMKQRNLGEVAGSQNKLHYCVML